MIKALIFDVDNTLIDRRKAFSMMLSENLHRWFDDETLIEQMLKDILEYDHNGAVEREVAFQKWIDKYHIDFITAEAFAAKWSAESGSTVYLFEDAETTLKILKKDYRLMLLTNGNAVSQRRKIASMHLDGLFEYSLVSSEFTCRKPDKEIFQYVCRINGLKEEECVYVGDSFEIDILGARNAGLKAVYINRSDEVHDYPYTIHQLAELIPLIQKEFR